MITAQPERICCANAGRIVVGVDEVGLGSLIGCVTSAAVILDGRIPGLADSKTISEKKRLQFTDQIKADCRFAIAHASLEEVNQIGIRAATMLAMTRAILAVGVPQGALIIIDGTAKPALPEFDIITLTKADETCPSVSAASIIAKTERDAIIEEMAREDDRYLWSKNKGYGTKDHIAAIYAHGPSRHHRADFAPVRQLLKR